MSGPSGVGGSEGEWGSGGVSEGGSCLHVDLDSAQVFGGADGRVHEGRECDLVCEDHGAEPKFYRVEFWGEVILCFNHWAE